MQAIRGIELDEFIFMKTILRDPNELEPQGKEEDLFVDEDHELISKEDEYGFEQL